MNKITKKYQNILVTGGAGYIGSACVQELIKQGYTVTIFDNLEYGHKHNVDFNNSNLIVGDLRDYRSILSALETVKPDAVIHFAAYALVAESCSDPLKYFNNNVTGGINLLMAMEHVGCHRIIFSSTCATYGIPTGNELISEDTPQHPINPYGTSKHIFEQIIKSYANHKNLEYTIFRYFNACGATASTGEEHTPETHLIPNVLNNVLYNKSPLKVFGDDYDTPDGTCIRDYIHISDLAIAHVKALSNNIMGEYNLGTGIGTSIKEIISLVEDISHKHVIYEINDRRPGDPDKLVANPLKAKTIIDWTPRKNIKDAIQDAYNFNVNQRK